jgi:hypothetical protein
LQIQARERGAATASFTGCARVRARKITDARRAGTGGAWWSPGGTVIAQGAVIATGRDHCQHQGARIADLPTSRLHELLTWEWSSLRQLAKRPVLSDTSAPASPPIASDSRPTSHADCSDVPAADAPIYAIVRSVGKSRQNIFG